MTPLKLTTAFLLTLLVAALPACADRPGAEKEAEIAIPQPSTAECKPSVHSFWAKFREAVLKEDWGAVADMTAFPLEVVGPGPDGAGRKHLSRSDFSKHFPQFLDVTHGGKYPRPDMTMRELIRDTPTLDKRACGDFEEQLHVGRWVFFLGSKGWRLEGILAPDFPPSMKDIPFQPQPRIKD